MPRLDGCALSEYSAIRKTIARTEMKRCVASSILQIETRLRCIGIGGFARQKLNERRSADRGRSMSAPSVTGVQRRARGAYAQCQLIRAISSIDVRAVLNEHTTYLSVCQLMGKETESSANLDSTLARGVVQSSQAFGIRRLHVGARSNEGPDDRRMTAGDCARASALYYNKGRVSARTGRQERRETHAILHVRISAVLEQDLHSIKRASRGGMMQSSSSILCSSSAAALEYGRLQRRTELSSFFLASELSRSRATLSRFALPELEGQVGSA